MALQRRRLRSGTTPFCRTIWSLALLPGMGCTAGGALAAPGDPQGPEFEVTNPSGPPISPLTAVAVDVDGDFIVTWAQYPSDDDADVMARRYNARGEALAAEFRINTFTTGSQEIPSVAIAEGGNFVVTWASADQDGSGYGIYARRFNASGIALGTEFRVNSFTSGDQYRPAVAMAADGDFVVVWDSDGQDGDRYGVFAQRFDASGMPQGSEFQVNNRSTDKQSRASVDMDADGDFVVAWDAAYQDGSGYGVFARRFDAAGVAKGDEFQVNTESNFSQEASAVGLDATGNLVIAWHSAAQDGSGFGVYAQRYDAAGVPQGTEFPVNEVTTDSQILPSIALDGEGNFVIAWESSGQDGDSYGVFARRYEASGRALAGEFQVNTFSTGNQFSPSIGASATGAFVVAWPGAGPGGFGIYARRFEGLESSCENESISANCTVNDIFGQLCAGTPGNDTIVGTRRRDVIHGGDGNDTLVGLDGNDLICGGAGNDVLRGGSGRDRLFGDAGNDRLRGGPENDLLRGGDGRDRLAGDEGNDRLLGDSGRDALDGGSGRDTCKGGPAQDADENCENSKAP